MDLMSQSIFPRYTNVVMEIEPQTLLC